MSSRLLWISGLIPTFPGEFGCWQREASIKMLSSTTNFPCKKKKDFRADEPSGWAVSFHYHSSCGAKWDKTEQLRDKREKLIVDVCYLKVKATRSLYRGERNMDLSCKRVSGRVLEPSALMNVLQPKHTSN